MINLLIALLMSLIPTPTEHWATFYSPGEDGWGTAVADPVLMRAHGGALPEESWGWPIVAVSRDVERTYGMGTWLWVEGIGLRRVSDRTAGWVRDVVDVRVREPRMQRYRVKVWRIL